MKYTLAVAMLLACAITLQAQEAPTETAKPKKEKKEKPPKEKKVKEPKAYADKKHACEFGVNATTFIKQFAILNENTFIPSSPYLFSYKFLFNKKHGFRAGLGFSFSDLREDPDSVNNVYQSLRAVDMRLGYEWQKPLGKFWTVYCGIDGRYSQSISHVTTVFSNDNKSTTISDIGSYGGGPTLGVQVSINDRVKLFTETGVYMMHGQSKEEVKFTQAPQNNSKERDVFNNALFEMPASLYIAFRF